MKNKHLLVGRELGRKKWTLKIGAINVAIFGKYAADFGFLALVTLSSSFSFLFRIPDRWVKNIEFSNPQISKSSSSFNPIFALKINL